MLVTPYQPPFNNVLRLLDEAGALYVLAADEVDSSGRCEIRRLWGRRHRRVALARESIWEGRWVQQMLHSPALLPRFTPVSIKKSSTLGVQNHIEELAHLEFALLWSPPGHWRPRLVNASSWSDDVVKRQLFATVRKGLECQLQDRLQHDQPEFEESTSKPVKGLSSSFALFRAKSAIGEKRPTAHNLVNSTTSSQKHGGRKWNLPQRSWQC